MFAKSALTRRSVLMSGLYFAFSGAFANARDERAPLSALDNLSREEAMRYLLSTYEDPVRFCLREIISRTTEDKRPRVEAAELHFELGETPFSFYAHAADYLRQKINVSLGGLSALETCAIAMALAKLDLDDGSWWFDYLLYHRRLRKQPNSFWVEPFDAAGMSSVYDQSERAIRFAASLFYDMMLFVVAHEAGHVALRHSATSQPDENDTDRLLRRRSQELAADRFALDIFQSTQTDNFGASYTLLAHMIIVQDNPAQDLSSTHPADHDRLLQMAQYGNSESEELKQLSKFAAVFQKQAAGVTGYEVIDTMAEGITREKLRIWRKNSHQ